ncbi:restriction endonuclease subunit S [Exiguobacterium sp. SH5S4]|uniref:restriction endonuclease subunit S n=1 Tax=Exiguobacterium sp. SH5S4 TaxID=2510961 RepID=UPI00103CF0F1|nr:restriction endonuclease subunit S [Exiguobacterium sp. SH5S4]TCI25384.1 restriction endonuclease subunit S [Exiguobacterium sp. SH5S4]
MEFKECYLSDICKYRKEKIATKELKRENYVSTNNMLPEKQGIGGLSDIPKNGNVNKFENGDVLISNIRPYFKKIWFSNKSGGSSPDVLIFQADEEKIIPEYLYYVLSQDGFFNFMVQTSKGTKMPRGDKSAIMQYKVPLYNKEYQLKIINFLSDLDSKIQNNKAIISNLEHLSQTLFKHWFIDFEFLNEEGKPYKSSGGEMVESELGEIPKYWSVDTLGNTVNVIDNRGKTPPLTEETFKFPIIDVKALAGNSRVIDYTNCRKFVSADTYKTWFRKGHPELMDTLISTVGSIGELKLFYYDKGCVAQNLVTLRSKDISKLYIYEYMRSIKNDLITYNIGSVQPSIKVTHFMKKQMIIPPYLILKNYESLALSFTQQIFSLDKENQYLTQLRDTFLPKFLSGEIEIFDGLEV